MSNNTKKDVLDDIKHAKQKLFFFWDEDNKTSLIIFLACVLSFIFVLLILLCCCCYQRRRRCSDDSKEKWYDCNKLKQNSKSSINKMKEKGKSKKIDRSSYEYLPSCPARSSKSDDKKIYKDGSPYVSRHSSTKLIDHSERKPLNHQVTVKNKTTSFSNTKICDKQCEGDADKTIHKKQTSVKTQQKNACKRVTYVDQADTTDKDKMQAEREKQFFDKVKDRVLCEENKRNRISLQRKKHKRCLERKINDGNNSDKSSVVLTVKVGLPKKAYVQECQRLDYYSTPYETNYNHLILTDSSTDKTAGSKKCIKQQVTKDSLRCTGTHKSNDKHIQNSISKHPKYHEQMKQNSQVQALNESIIKQNPTYVANEEKLAELLKKSTVQPLKGILIHQQNPVRDIQAVPERLLRNDSTSRELSNWCGMNLEREFWEMLNELRDLDDSNTPERDSVEVVHELSNESSNNFGKSDVK